MSYFSRRSNPADYRAACPIPRTQPSLPEPFAGIFIADAAWITSAEAARPPAGSERRRYCLRCGQRLYNGERHCLPGPKHADAPPGRLHI